MAKQATIANGSRPALWLVLAAGPLAWGVRLLSSYALVSVACGGEAIGRQVVGLPVLAWVVLAITVATGAVCVIAGIASWRMLQRARHVNNGETALLGDRTQLIATSGLFLNVFFLGVIALEGAAVFFLDICSGQSRAV
ncbi:MAG: hypothetical protein WD533_01175 [Dehalococcoidia bacterium]